MLILCRALFLAGAVLPISASAQSATAPHASPVPTTKILAVGHLTAPLTDQMRQHIMPTEVRDTVRLYLNGKIDQWYVRQDQAGVVFVMNVTSVQEAEKLLEDLPLGKAKLMKFDLVPMGPLNPLRLLLGDAAPATKTP